MITQNNQILAVCVAAYVHLYAFWIYHPLQKSHISPKNSNFSRLYPLKIAKNLSRTQNSPLRPKKLQFQIVSENVLKSRRF